MDAYRTFTINGRAYPDTAPIQAPVGTEVRLRLVNAGYLTHLLHLHGTSYRLVALDGTELAGPTPTGDLLPIAAGQRLDIQFRMPRGIWSLHDHSGLPGADEMRVLLGQGTRASRDDANALRSPAPPVLDLARYGRPATARFSQSSTFDRVFRLTIAQQAGAMGGMSGMVGMGHETVYTLNGQTFPHTAELRVRAGQRVEITFVNRSAIAHPMHLHGHRMQILALNGEPVRGSPLYQDTVLILPRATTTVAFVADNPGLWMLHCHELHHAASGLDTMLQYQGVPRRFALGGPSGNVPE
jgi:FtsP/CotA-like multicopper oxidase with cupredoxin domain